MYHFVRRALYILNISFIVLSFFILLYFIAEFIFHPVNIILSFIKIVSDIVFILLLFFLYFLRKRFFPVPGIDYK